MSQSLGTWLTQQGLPVIRVGTGPGDGFGLWWENAMGFTTAKHDTSASTQSCSYGKDPVATLVTAVP